MKAERREMILEKTEKTGKRWEDEEADKDKEYSRYEKDAIGNMEAQKKIKQRK
jgi:hypothetical protein